MKLLKYLPHFLIALIFISFSIYSFIRAEEHQKEVKALKCEVQKLSEDLAACQDSVSSDI